MTTTLRRRLAVAAVVLAVVAGVIGGCAPRRAERAPRPVSPAPPPASGGAPGEATVKLVRSYPRDGGVDVATDGALLLEFDVPIASQSLGAAVTFEPDVRGVWERYGGSTVYAFRSSGRMAADTKYTLKVGPGLKHESGAPVAGAFVITYRTKPSPAITFAWPSWSPDGRRVAYWRTGDPGGTELRVAEVAAGADPRTLDSRGGPDGPPVWFDAGTVAYAGRGPTAGVDNRPFALGVWKTPAVGGTRVQVVDGGDLGEPTNLTVFLSTDRKTMVLQAGYGGVDAHSDVMQALVMAQVDGSDQPQRALGAPGGTQRFLGWGAGGVLFLDTFAMMNHSHTFGYDLWWSDLRGAATACVTVSRGEPFVRNFGGASWAGDRGVVWTWRAVDTSDRILHEPAAAYAMLPFGGTGGAGTSGGAGTVAGGKGPWRLEMLDLGSQVREAAISPDGKTLAFTVNAGGRWEIRVAPWNAGSVQVASAVTVSEPGIGQATSPAWSPDGRWLAYVVAGGGQDGLWVVGADGGGRRRLDGR
jgi:hypothetical protein